MSALKTESFNTACVLGVAPPFDRGGRTCFTLLPPWTASQLALVHFQPLSSALLTLHQTHHLIPSLAVSLCFPLGIADLLEDLVVATCLLCRPILTFPDLVRSPSHQFTEQAPLTFDFPRGDNFMWFKYFKNSSWEICSWLLLKKVFFTVHRTSLQQYLNK